MQSALDVLAEIGHSGLAYFWQPVLTWTVLALLAGAVLERWSNGHPLVKYRLYQALLLSLPLGVLLNAVTDFSFLYVYGPSPGEVSIGPLAAWVVGTEPDGRGMEIEFLVQIGVGLLSMAALLAVIVRGIKLLDQASSLADLRHEIEPRSAHEVLDAEATRLIRWAAPYRDVRIAVVQEPVVPMTFGVFTPVIVLPASLLANPTSLRMAVAHELVHIRRYDALQHWMEEGIEVACAGWPVVRSVRRHIRTYREVSCDLETLNEPSFSRKAYAQLLGSFSLDGIPKVAASLGMAASPNELKRRISAMKNDTFRTVSSSQVLRASLGGAAAMLFCLLFIVACTDLIGPDNALREERTIIEASPIIQEKPLWNEDDVFLVVEQQPRFPGGMEALMQFMQKEVRYPEIARKAGIQGKVFVQFVVGKDGRIGDVEVVRGIGGGCDVEAVRLVKSMPDWEPGKQDGKAVKVRFSMPITFKLQEQNTQELLDASA